MSCNSRSPGPITPVTTIAARADVGVAMTQISSTTGNVNRAR
jgi:hypothetical protein